MRKQEFLSRIGIVAFRGKIYVSDSTLNKVFIFDAEGRLSGEFQGEFKRRLLLHSTGRVAGSM